MKNHLADASLRWQMHQEETHNELIARAKEDMAVFFNAPGGQFIAGESDGLDHPVKANRTRRVPVLSVPVRPA